MGPGNGGIRMRVKALGLGMVVLAAALAGCGKKNEAADGKVAATEPASAPATAAAAQPKRKAGLWEQSMTTAGHSMTTKICTDEAFEQKTNVLVNTTMPG